jgi:hypothetical protein
MAMFIKVSLTLSCFSVSHVPHASMQQCYGGHSRGRVIALCFKA